MTEHRPLFESDRIALELLEPHVYRLTMRDDANGNRLDEGLLAPMLQALGILAARPDLKVVVLEGGQDVFCAGASLDFLRRLARREIAERAWAELPRDFLSFPVPIVGAARGHAVGGGLMLALYCDVVVAADESRYGLNFSDLGFTPGMGATELLPELVGAHFASEMLLTGKLYRGRELHDKGLFNHIVPRQNVDGVVLELARRIAEKPRHVLSLLKDVLSAPRRRALQAALEREESMHAACFAAPGTAQLIEDHYLG